MTKKIAIIDDNPDIIKTIEFGFEENEKDWKVVGFEKPKEFLTHTLLEKYDAILLDIMMPEMSGWEVLAILRNQNNKNRKTPILFLTAKTDDQSVRLGQVGSQDYITKPFDIDDLIKRVKKHLE